MTKLGMLGGIGAPEIIILLIVIGIPVLIIWLVNRKKK
jgi:hypothetical protein